MTSEAFFIRLLPIEVRDCENERVGEIQVGDFIERFSVYPIRGSVEDVAARWLDELRSLVRGDASAVGLATASNMTWVFYHLADDDVRVQQMLMLPGVGPILDRSGRVRRLPTYAAEDEEGQRISEWVTTPAAIRAFLDE